LAEALEREHVEAQRQAERQEQELARLEQELGRSQEELSRRKRAAGRNRGDASSTSRPWWRRLLLVVGVLLGILITWFISLAVALNMLAS
jgi:ferric-dicitrate binding protein FerR (iron transport regulator)